MKQDQKDRWMLGGAVIFAGAAAYFVHDWLTAFAEVAVATVIYWEMEVQRLDKFLELAFDRDHTEARKLIFDEFMKLDSPPTANRSELFLEKILSNEKLRDACEMQISLFVRISAGLPSLGLFRRRALRWYPHSVVWMLHILYPYIILRRKNTGPWWAEDFVELCYECLAFMHSRGIDKLTLTGPQGHGMNGYTLELSKFELVQVLLKESKVT